MRKGEGGSGGLGRALRRVSLQAGRAKWEKIGGPQQRGGTWNSVSKVCYIGVQFNSADKKYLTLNLDIIVTLEEGGETVRKRAKGTITASYPNGKCLSAPAKSATK